MIIVIAGGPKSEINDLLDKEGLDSDKCLAIRKSPRDPSKFDFVVGQKQGRTDVSLAGMPIFINPDVDKNGVYRLDRNGIIISLTKDP